MTEQRQSWQASSHKSRRVSSASIVVAVTIGLTVNLIFCDHTRAQSPLVDKPKLIPLVAAESYAEGSSVNLLCTLAQGAQGASLTFDWSKDGTRLAGAGNDNANNNYHIERNQDHSLLRIPHVKTSDAGEYKCTAKNQLGYDTTAVRLLINVKLSWIKEPKDTSVALNRELSVECQAKGEPKPRIRWEKLDNHQPYTFSSSINAPYNVNKTSQAQSRHSSSQLSSLVSDTRFLNFSHTSLSDSGIYECIASNGFDKDLRKVIQVQVHVPARFGEKFSVVQVKSGESAKLECNATGDQPLTVNWFKDENVKLSKRGSENYEIYETMTSTGLNSVLVMRTVARGDGMIYKCNAENEYGKDEKLTKLVIVEVPSKPLNVRVKDVWSRSASIIWSSPYAGNSPITSYVIQYWKRQLSSSQSMGGDIATNSAQVASNPANHRRQEFTVSGSQTSALITSLNPALVYEVSVIAENQVGRSEPSDNLVIVTGEEEPMLAPTDVHAEARGSSTLKVSWKAPPVESWNGKLLGFYVGFRPRGPGSSNTIDVNSSPNLALGSSSGGASGANGASAFSFRTVDTVKGQTNYECMLTGLIKGYEYEIVVKTFNSAGSGPDSHSVHVRTYDGDLPGAANLFAYAKSVSSVSVRWTTPSRTSLASIKRYVLFYQREGDDQWLELAVPIDEKTQQQQQQQGQQQGQQQQQQQAIAGPTSSNPELGPDGYVLSGLDPGTTYRMYLVAVNNFGMGDPSNIIVTKTDLGNIIGESVNSGSATRDFNGNMVAVAATSQFDAARQQHQLMITVLIMCTVIIVAAIVATTMTCMKRMQRMPVPMTHPSWSSAHGDTTANTMQTPGSSYPTQRYGEYDPSKSTMKTPGSVAGSDQNSSGNGLYPLPYGTLPMNAVVISDQKPWDRPHSIMVKEPLKPQMAHIYDSPQ